VAHPQIATFARLAKENSQPERLIAGQKTFLSRTMHDIRYDAIHDEMLVTNPFARAILVFRGGAEGEEAPLRVIQGPNTLMGGADRLDVDPVHNEIFVAEGDRVLVYAREANGDAAPIRILQGPDTQLEREGTLSVDPINNVIAVSPDEGPTVRRGTTKTAMLKIFNRTDSGNAKPRGVIGGPKSGIVRINQMQSYPPKGWIVATQPGLLEEQHPEDIFIGVWHFTDNGDVPPRFKIGGGPKAGLVKPRGVALNPANKELLVADMRLNSVLTFYFPEMF